MMLWLVLYECSDSMTIMTLLIILGSQVSILQRLLEVHKMKNIFTVFKISATPKNPCCYNVFILLCLKI